MKRLLALLALSAAAQAAPPDVPKEVRAKVGQLTRVVVKSGSEVGMARGFSDTDAFFDELVSKPGERRFVFQANAPGRYTVAFWTKGEVEGVVCVVIVGDGPDPGPGPTPVPEPTDPLWPTVKARFAEDASSGKGSVSHAKALAAIYRKAASSTAKDPGVATDKALQEIMHDAANMGIGSMLPTTRRALADETNTRMSPTNVRPLTDERRKQYAELFTRFELMLEAVK